MQLALRSRLMAVFLALAGTAVAGPLEDGNAAYRQRDYATALRLWQPLAEQGEVRAQTMLGFIYFNGQGVPQDYAEATKWFGKAAEQGSPEAQGMLGFMYENGQGVPQDYAEAMKWYRKAVEQGMATAQTALGFMYENGGGVPQDYVIAHMWFNLAAAQGDGDALKERELVADKMTPEQIAKAQRLAREWKPTPTGKN